MLYDYLTGNEFRGQVEAIVEGFMAMKQSITKERIQMEKIWKEREKQLEKVLLSTSGMYGSVKGIAGASISDIPLLDGDDDEIGTIKYLMPFDTTTILYTEKNTSTIIFPGAKISIYTLVPENAPPGLGSLGSFYTILTG